MGSPKGLLDSRALNVRVFRGVLDEVGIDPSWSVRVCLYLEAPATT